MPFVDHSRRLLVEFLLNLVADELAGINLIGNFLQRLTGGGSANGADIFYSIQSAHNLYQLARVDASGGCFGDKSLQIAGYFEVLLNLIGNLRIADQELRDVEALLDRFFYF